MVFESLVVDLVNRFLGDFIENLDTSQLSIGIWGGDVLLNNLFIKENLFNDLDLPIRIIYGNIGQLKLKIPWKNLYTEPTVAILDGLYIIAVPNSSVAYDEKKEEKAAWDSKQKELSKVEEAKKRDAEKDVIKDAKQDSFAEKLVANVVKNLEVKVTNIHIRFEDSFSNQDVPFSIGITLKEVSCQTTDENWNIKTIKENATIFHKLLKLDSLSVYWNISPTFYKGQDRGAILQCLKSNIADRSSKTDYVYVIEPLTSMARLKLNTKPEQDGFQLPKILFQVVFEEISIAFTRLQYKTLMEFLDSFERMNLSSKYRKYRPIAPKKKNAKLWWHFSMDCVLNELVRRRRNMWSWDALKEHRDTCRKYKNLYKQKIITSKPSTDLLADLEKCERTLDVLNITIQRRQAEIEVEKEGLNKPQQSSGWFGGWLSWGGGKSTSADEKSIGDKVQEAMTAEEKKKLYEAIGYQENVDTVFPKEFVATSLKLKLNSLKVKLLDTSIKNSEIMNLQLKNVETSVEQRPAAEAMKVVVSLESLSVSGQRSTDESQPCLVSCDLPMPGLHMVDVLFETNPIDALCDSRVALKAQPLKIVYHATTIISLADFFKPPESIQLVQLRAAAFAGLERMREQTVAGLQYAIEQQKFTEVSVQVQPFYVLMPQRGIYKQGCRMMVLDLGQLSVANVNKRGQSEALPMGKRSIEEVKSGAYDQFELKMHSFQVLFVNPGDNWEEARRSADSPMHVIKPMALNVSLHKCLLEDIQLPKMRVIGDLPTLTLSLSDERLADMLDLFNSIPLPQSNQSEPSNFNEDEELKTVDLKNFAIQEESAYNISKVNQLIPTTPDITPSKPKLSNLHEAVNMEVKFVVKEICLVLSKMENSIEIPTLKVVVMSLGTDVVARPLDNQVSVYLGGIYLQYTRFKALNDESLINLVNTPNIADEHSNLLSIDLVMAQKKHPEFWSKFKGTLQKVSISMTDLEVLFHQEAILGLLSYSQSIQEKLQSRAASVPETQQNLLQVGRQLSRTSLMSLSAAVKKEPKRATKKKKEKEVVDVAVEVKLDNVILCVSSHHKLLSEMRITGLETSVTLQKSATCVECSLKDITVCDKSEGTSYGKILYFEGSQAFKAGVIVHNNATQGAGYLDMKSVDTSVTVRTGCMKVIFINKFIQDLLGFLNQFEEAKASIIEAGSAAKEKAAAAAQDLSEKASRLGLDIEIKAPVVIVPRNRASHQCLVVDLGLLRVQNSFRALPAKDHSGLPAVLDTMTVQLTSVKIFRASVVDEMVKSENPVMEPTDLVVSIGRNLSASWYHGIPGVEINGRLKQFAISVDQGDLRTVLLILSENLGEATPNETASKSPAKVQPSTTTPPVATKSLATATKSTTVQQLQPEQTIQPELSSETKSEVKDVYSTLKAKFDVECIQVKLYAGGLKDEAIPTTPASPKWSLLSPLSPTATSKMDKDRLAFVELKMMSLVCDMKSDASMVADLSILLFQICDARPEKSAGITKMFSNTGASDKTSKDAKMMNLLYEQDSSANKSVDIKLNQLEVIVCLEFLLKLSDFYVQSSLPQEPGRTPEVTQVQVKKEAATSAVQTTSDLAPASQSEMKIQFVMNRSNVILVEDPMKRDTNALSMQMEIDFLMRTSPALQTMKGSIKDFSIFSCIFSNPESTKSHILSPLTVQLQSCAPYGKNPHIALTVTDVNLLVSAASIRTITATLAPLSKPPTDTVEDILNKIPKELWSVKKLENCRYWFLNKSADVDMSAICADEFHPDVVERGEQMLMSSSRIGVTLLGGYGKRLQPLTVLEVYVNNFEAKNWSSKLCMSCDVTVQAAYYNEKMAAWEPIVEPVEVDNRHQPWTISVSMKQNEAVSVEEDDVDSGLPSPPPAKSSISVVSHDVMQITITKSLLQVLNNLSNSFSDAYALVEMPTVSGEVLAPYVINNVTGVVVTVKYDDSFKCITDQPEGNGTSQFLLHTGKTVEFRDVSKSTATGEGHSVDPASRSPSRESTISFSNIYGNVIEENMKKFSIFFNDFGISREVRAMRGEKRAFSINRSSGAGDPLQVVVHTKISYGCRIIIIKSVLKVTNKMPLPMMIFYKLGDDATGRCGQVEAGESVDLPCEVTATPPYMLFFKPANDNYSQSIQAFAWQTPANQAEGKFFECKSTSNQKQSIFMAVKVEQDCIWHEFTEEKTVKTYNVILMPSVIFKNLLPLPVLCKSEAPEGDGIKVEPGCQVHLTSVQPGESALSIFLTYQRRDWTSRQIVETGKSALNVWTFESVDDNKRITLDLGIHSDTSAGHLQLSLYCPYWVVNLTGQSLSYKASDTYIVDHPSNFKEIVFILLKRSMGSATTKVSLKVGESDWSDKFSLDTAGSLGTVECKSKNHPNTTKSSKDSSKSVVGVKIALATNGLTKIVTFTPYFMIINQANFTIMFKEHLPGSDWTEIKPGDCIPYWPVQTSAKKLLVACIQNSSLETQPFEITEDHTTLLKLYHDYGGINVVCQRSEGATTVTFQQYFNGFASVLLVNQSDTFTLQYKQKDSLEAPLELPPQSSVLYTWQNPLDKRELIWSCGDKKNSSDELIKDGIGDFAPQANSKLYWVSFLDGMQRVLLFTTDLVLATAAQQAGELEQLDQEFNLSLQGVGLSLVNNFVGKEIAYIGITSSGIIWEHLKRKRFRALKTKHSCALEEAYQEYRTELIVNKAASGKKTVGGKIEADFGSEPMHMMKPNKMTIRRSFEYGIWIKYSTSKHSIQLHLKIHRMQLDNQLPGAVFPTVLAPVPPPKSVASESVPKPYVEMSAMIRTSTHSSVKQFKYCKLLVQEMAVKVDQGFLNAIVALFTSGKSDNKTQELVDFRRESGLVDQTLMEDARTVSGGDVKNFYDMLHFSPLKIHLSFSLYGGSEGNSESVRPEVQWDVLGLFLQSVGVVLTDMQDVVFKLGYFERKFTFYSQSQLVSEITQHYSQQAIKQMYVLVLGLDVLGNPFGMIRGLAEGIESLFYEPYQGAIQGPEEFAEGLALGVRSLLGHAVGGAAGAVSRITGALGKGIATLTMDEDYQKKRREELNKRPADLKEGLARGGKGLVMGVVDGVTGIVTKPVEGAKQEGIGGFFKGMGKGLMGVFTRPASGVIDFASSSFDGIRRVAEQSEESVKLRPMRLIQGDKIVRPYITRNAEGNQVLQDVGKGNYASDLYIGHMVVSGDSKCVFLITDKHVIFASKGDIFGHWDCDWSYTWEQLKEPPSLGIKGIQIILKERQKKFLGNGSIGKIVNIQDKDRKQAEFLVGKMKVAMASATMK